MAQAAGCNRREFLQRTAAASVALGLGACTADEPDKGGRVLVVGGGLAGLRILDLLRSKGHNVRLFEASKTIGGRIRTLRTGLPEGLCAEQGAERIPDGHARVQALVAELGLEFADYPQYAGRFVLRLGDRFHEFSGPEDLPGELLEGLNERERKTQLWRLHALYCNENTPVAPADPRTGLRWLQDQGMSPAGMKFAQALCFLPLEQMGAHEFWKATVETNRAGRWRTLAGGVDQVTRRLAARHPEQILLGTEIRTVTLGDAGVTLRDSKGETHRGTVAVLALPHAPLQRLEIRPGRPAFLERRMEGLAVASELKIHATYSAKELRSDGILPWMMGLDFPRMTWPSASISSSGRRVLNAMAIRQDIPAVKAALRNSPDSLLGLMASRLPHIKTFGPEIFAHDFGEDPLIGGAYTYRTPGSRPRSEKVREGTLVVAGSDHSPRPGWMEGALESAESAVREILAS